MNPWQRIAQALDAGWEEGKHKRNHGQFSSGGGSSGGAPAKPAAAKPESSSVKGLEGFRNPELGSTLSSAGFSHHEYDNGGPDALSVFKGPGGEKLTANLSDKSWEIQGAGEEEYGQGSKQLVARIKDLYGGSSGGGAQSELDKIKANAATGQQPTASKKADVGYADFSNTRSPTRNPGFTKPVAGRFSGPEGAPAKPAAEASGYNAGAVQKEMSKDPRIKGKESKAIHSLLKGRH